MAKSEHEAELAEEASEVVPDTDPTRLLILARRARFVAAALASAGIAAASCEGANEAPPPQVCLIGGVGVIGTGGTAGTGTGGAGGMPPPQVCLSGGSVAHPPVVNDDASDDDAGAMPLPCLT